MAFPTSILREKTYGQECIRLRTRFYYFGKRENDFTILRGREYDSTILSTGKIKKSVVPVDRNRCF